MRKKIQFGFFKTFQFLVALTSVSCLADSPRVYHVKPDTPKEIIETILGDVHSKQLLALDQCGDCRKRSLNCSTCKFCNSQSSLVDMKELKLLSEHMWVEPCSVDPGVSRIWVNYPLNGDIRDLYGPGLSNSNQMLGQSKALFKKLKKAGLADAFQEQMVKSVNEGHMEILT
jgi:hypothetical protein